MGFLRGSQRRKRGGWIVIRTIWIAALCLAGLGGLFATRVTASISEEAVRDPDTVGISQRRDTLTKGDRTRRRISSPSDRRHAGCSGRADRRGDSTGRAISICQSICQANGDRDGRESSCTRSGCRPKCKCKCKFKLKRKFKCTTQHRLAAETAAQDQTREEQERRWRCQGCGRSGHVPSTGWPQRPADFVERRAAMRVVTLLVKRGFARRRLIHQTS